MEQIVYRLLLGTKKFTNGFIAIKIGIVVSNIIITNIQKTLESTNSRAKHTYIINNY